MRRVSKKYAVDVVRKRLWSHGYSVQTVSPTLGFDLMVDGVTLVEVIPGGNPNWPVSKSTEAVALVVQDELSDEVTIYFGFAPKGGVLSKEEVRRTYSRFPREIFSKETIKKNHGKKRDGGE